MLGLFTCWLLSTRLPSVLVPVTHTGFREQHPLCSSAKTRGKCQLWLHLAYLEVRNNCLCQDIGGGGLSDTVRKTVETLVSLVLWLILALFPRRQDFRLQRNRCFFLRILSSCCNSAVKITSGSAGMLCADGSTNMHTPPQIIVT